MVHKAFRFSAVLFFVFVLCMSVFTPALAAPPDNDNFASAEIIASLPFVVVVDNSEATAELDEPNVCTFPFQSVWYRFTPAEDMYVRVTMPVNQVGGAVSFFQSTGPGITDLTHLTCTYSGTSTNLQLTSGETYYLRVDSFFNQPGSLQFSLEQITPPANDNFAEAASIASLPFSASVNNTTATAEPGESQVCSFPFQGVWYTFTPAEDMAVRMDVQGSQVFAAATIFQTDSPGLPGLVSVGCAYTDSPANLLLNGGETYSIRLDSSGTAGDLQLNMEQIFPPANDSFATPQVISSLPFNASVNNVLATVEPGEPQTCDFPFRSLWYVFSPSQDMAARLTISGESFSGRAGLFLATGPSIADLSLLNCAFIGISTNVQFQGGETYYLRIDSAGRPGDFQVTMEEIFPPANDNFANAQLINTLPFMATADITDATSEVGEPFGCGFSGKSLWYTLTPADDLAVRMSTAGSAATATINLYRAEGPAITELSQVTCVGSTPQHLVLEGGTTYYLQVDAFAQGGTIQVNLEALNPPANDNLAGAEVVDAIPFTHAADISDATFEPNEPLYCGNTPGTLWYVFQPAETVSLRANMLGSSVDANVSVLRGGGTGWNGLDFVGCSFGGSMSFVAEAGSTYYFQVGSASGQTGMLQFNLVPVAPPSNDHFVDAVEVSSLPFSASVDASDATTEQDEQQICTSMPGTVWYSFTATETLKVRADTLGSAISANVNVYQAVGEGVSSLQFLNCSAFSGAAAFLAEAGQTYYFQVGGSGQAGPVQLNLAEVPFISGRVTDATSGLPLPGNTDPSAFVQLYRICGENCLEFVNSQTTDENGRFSFDTYYFGTPLPASEYQIHVFANLYYTEQFGPFSFSLSSLDAGDLALTPSAIVRGRLVDAVSGEPLAGASLTLNRCHDGSCFEFVNSQSSDTDGAFRFNSYYFPEPLAAGTYELLISAPGYEPERVELVLAKGEDHNLGDVPVDPIPTIGSISGRLVDAVTGSPLTPDVSPFVELQLCNPDFCSTVAGMQADGEGRFRFETDALGTPLAAGTYRILAYADQYESVFTEPFEVGEGMHRTVGDVPVVSSPVRFTDVQACDVIPASGGECEFSVRISNGMNRALRGRTWSIADINLPSSFITFSQFQVKDPQDIDLGVGRSRIFRFRLKVPEHNSPFDGSVCAQVFAGEGSQAYFNTLGNRFLFCIVRSGTGFEIVSPEEVMAESAPSAQAAAAVAEVEPNNACQSAQDMGLFSGPQTVNGSLDSGETADIDFFRFTGTPGAAIAIDHEGSTTGKGTLADPLLGFFDSNCSLITYNDDNGSLNSYLEVSVPDDGVFILAATSYPDFGFLGGGFGSYQLTVEAIEPIGSIRGVVVDAVTGAPLAGENEPFAFVSLLECNPFFCSTVNFQPAASDGSFRFETDFNGNPLLNRHYQVYVSANQYQPAQSERFKVFAGDDYNAGSIALQSYPVRFSDLQVCSVPSQGGQCDFSVRLTNGLPTKFTGRAWTLVDGFDLASHLGYTRFQPDTTRDVSLNPGASTVLRFRFRVPGGVPDGATLCVAAFVGQNPNPFYNTAGIQNNLFCFQKGAEGFTLLTGTEMQAHLHQGLIHDPLPFTAPDKPGR